MATEMGKGEKPTEEAGQGSCIRWNQDRYSNGQYVMVLCVFFYIHIMVTIHIYIYIYVDIAMANDGE